MKFKLTGTNVASEKSEPLYRNVPSHGVFKFSFYVEKGVLLSFIPSFMNEAERWGFSADMLLCFISFHLSHHLLGKFFSS